MTDGVLAPPEPTIHFTNAPTDAEFAALFNALDRETAQAIGPCRIEPLALLLHDTTNTVIGGLSGRTVYAWMVIEMLFVPVSMRGRGIGAALMRNAEDIARARNCVGIQLTCLDFQAPSFYLRCGFTLFGVQADVPPGHSCFHMSKRLDTYASANETPAFSNSKHSH